MAKNFRLIWALLTGRERRRFVGLLALTILMALLEVAGVAAIWPFLTLIGSDAALPDWALQVAGLTGAEDRAQLILTAGAGVLILLVGGMAVRAIGTYAQIRFAMQCGYALSTRVLNRTLHQPYAWFLGRNSADMAKDLLSDIDMIARQSILPALIVTSGLAMTLAVAGVLLAVDPAVALGLGGGLVLAYALIFVGLRRPLDRIGTARIGHNRARFRAVQEIGASVKEIKFRQMEDTALTRFAHPARGVAHSQSIAQSLGRLPRFALEALIYGGMIGLILALVGWRGRDLSDLVPLFGLIGVAAIKLFPALQQVYAQASLIRFTLPTLQQLHDRMQALPTAQPRVDQPPIPLKQSLILDHVRYTYPGSDTPVLHDLTLAIPAGSTLGIMGGTGAGKTTLIDLLLGLLVPTSGRMIVDGQVMTPDRIGGWQKGLGYVPQTIFLSDDTIAANIAFGVPPDQIDTKALHRAVRIACLSDVIAQLPQGIDTQIGEAGARLSGGQRQRIGIARALYADPDVLVLDEATSALDPITERAVIDALQTDRPDRTVVMIAHRTSSLRHCDRIVRLEGGRIQATPDAPQGAEPTNGSRSVAHV